MSFPSLGNPYLSKEQKRMNEINSDENAFGKPTDASVTENRRKQIIERFQKIIDDKEIEQLNFENREQYNDWFRKNIILALFDYDRDDRRILPLYITICIRYYHKINKKFGVLSRLEKQMLMIDIQKLTKLQKDELKTKLQNDGYNTEEGFIESLFPDSLGGSRRKQSKRRMRKTQHRRKRNNRKSKKSKQV
jgi:hypothetical protein